jgi:hypothetical protein
VLASLEESFGDGPTDLTTGLTRLLKRERLFMELRIPYANDCNPLDAIDKASRLVFGICGSHAEAV